MGYRATSVPRARSTLGATITEQREVQEVAWAGRDSRSRRVRRRIGGRLRWAQLRAEAGPSRVTGSCEVGPRSSLRMAGRGTLRIGSDVVFAADFEAYVQGELVLGDRVYVGRWTLISVFESVRIGSGVRLGERVSIHDENHSSVGDDYVAAPVVIEDDVWIGAGVTVLPGVRVGRGAVVGAGSVVTRSVEPRTVVAGVPARPIGSRPS